MYTIQFLLGGEVKRAKVLNYLQQRLAKDGRFRCTLTPSEVATTKSDRQSVFGPNRPWLNSQPKMVPAILVSRVRLIKAKPYCGNHPGECQVSSRPKPVSTYLEWDDWVKFHSLVNKVLNRFQANANVWSLPPDVKGKMWIRKNTQGRQRYDWTERVDNYGRVVRDWNPGTEDQFR